MAWDGPSWPLAFWLPCPRSPEQSRGPREGGPRAGPSSPLALGTPRHMLVAVLCAFSGRQACRPAATGPWLLS